MIEPLTLGLGYATTEFVAYGAVWCGGECGAELGVDSTVLRRGRDGCLSGGGNGHHGRASATAETAAVRIVFDNSVKKLESLLWCTGLIG